MVRQIPEEIVNSLRWSTSGDGGASRWAAFDARAWRQALPWLDRSGLALYFLKRLIDTQADPSLPREAHERLSRNWEANRRRVAEMRDEFNALNRCFERAGIRYAVLKGFALIPDYSADASLRSTSDFDYLLDSEFLEEAGGALRSEGYVPSREADGHLVYTSTQNPCRLPSSLAASYSAQLGREVELHLRLWDAAEEKFDLSLPAQPLDRAQSRTWEGITFRTFSDEDQFLFQGVHAFWHVLHGGCRMSNLYEIAQFLVRRGSDARLWREVSVQLTGRNRLCEALGIIFDLISRLFGAEPPAEIQACTVKALGPAKRLWVERYGTRLAFRNFSGNKFGLFLHREFIEDFQAWRQVRRRRLFPFHRTSRATQGATHLFSRGVSREVRGYMFRWLTSRLLGPVGYAIEWPRWQWSRWRKLRNASGSGGIQPSVPLLSANFRGQRPPVRSAEGHGRKPFRNGVAGGSST